MRSSRHFSLAFTIFQNTYTIFPYGNHEPNGAGKTTTIRCMMDFIRPTCGSISILNKDAQKDGVGLKHKIGYLSGNVQFNTRWTGEEKREYYQALRDYNATQKTRGMERIVALAVIESLHKHLTYLKGENIVRLSEYIKANQLSAPAITNAARPQTIPAFREKRVWEIKETTIA